MSVASHPIHAHGNMPRVTFAQLRALQAVARTGNVTRAADELGTTQPAVSHAVRNLERELDVALLIRRSTGVMLTPAGRDVSDRAGQILTQLEGLHQAVDAARGQICGSLRLGVIPSINASLLPRILRAFHASYRSVRLTVLEGSDHEVVEWLQTGAVDVATITTPADNLATTPLVSDQMMAILPADHPLSARTALAVEDIAQEPFIMSASGCEPLIADLARRAKVRLRSHYHVRDSNSILGMVAERLGVTIMPELALRTDAVGVRAIPLTPREHRTVLLAVPADAPALPTATAFVELAANMTTGEPQALEGPKPPLRDLRPLTREGTSTA
jgi:DNA-binding transcriptional LysR family regulator